MSRPGPVMLDLKSTSLDSLEREYLQHPACGGVILFARNIEHHRQVLELNRSIKSINSNLLLAVDQEGGRVQRLTEGFTRLLPLRDIERKAPDDAKARQLAFHHARVMALEVLSVGFDISFTPVLDIATDTSRVIGDRAFHESPQRITELASEYVDGMISCGMSATGKHFPGHGSVDADSHVEIPIDDRSLADITEYDLQPFRALAKKLGGVMPAHVIYPQVDPLPAGFSKLWIEEVLRIQFGFDGVVFSDDLSMKGAESVGNFVERSDAALEAGCDMVLVCNNPSAAEQVLDSFGEQKLACHRQSSARISLMISDPEYKVGLDALKRSNGLWQQSREFLNALNWDD